MLSYMNIDYVAGKPDILSKVKKCWHRWEEYRFWKKKIDKIHDLENRRVVWITDHNKLIATYPNEKDG